MNRRDFLKVGGLAALAAPVINVVGRMNGYDLVESDDQYGGFLIRRHSRDNPPYEVDENIYQRMDGRKPIDPMKMQMMTDNALANLQAKKPGFSRFDAAFHSSAWTVAMGLGTNGTMTNNGLYSWDVIPNAYGPGSPKYFEMPRWVPSEDGLTIDEVTSMVKRTALFYGASLVGIAPVDERWFYSKVFDINLIELMDENSTFFADAGFEMPESSSGVSPRLVVQNAMLAMDKKDMKDLIIAATENVDPSVMPAGLTLGAIKAMPAGMFQKMLPNVITTFTNEYLYAMATRVPAEFYPADFDPITILEEEFEVLDVSEAIPGAAINFYNGEKSYYDSSKPEGEREYFVSDKMKYVIVLAFEMDQTGLQTEQGMIPEAAVAMGYSRMAFTAGTLAQFIRDLGYNAIPMGNDTSLSVPMAIDAGLGELSRAGYVITPRYGPRVRLAKVVTDLPLVTDQPISFGVTEFCEICKMCGEHCPSGAISMGERNFEVPSLTGNPGVYKWAVNGALCQQQWTDSGVSCSICLHVCPFNKPEGWLHDATRVLIGAKSGTIDKILLKLDQASGYGEKGALSSEEFWKRDDYTHIKG